VLLVLAVTTASAGAALGGLPWPADTDVVTAPSPTPSLSPTPSPTPTPTPEPPADAVFTLVAGGDVLTHLSVNQSARIDGGYDFVPLLAPVDPYVAGADLALCHLEIPVAPPGVAPSGFPLFGAPAEIVPALAANGWDGCSTASNHSVDRGAAGVIATLDALDAAGLGHVGTARTAEEAAAPQVYRLEREGQSIRVAQIAATYGTNGLPVPADAPWMVNLIDTAALAAQATAAREAGADIVVASIHCCVEYVTDPTAEQVRIATELGASGTIDLLIGHHAHVPQPVDRVPGGPQGDGMWVAYGLGNFISNQGPHADLSPRTESGLLLTATFTKPMDGPAVVTTVDWTGITVDRRAGHRVLPLSELAAAGAGTQTLTPGEVLARHALVTAAAGAQAPERTAPPEPTGPAPFVVPRGWVP
jgi:poly-gamma-glutamate synthesis protein (capsule biosynthesis protein)